ncbi:MAG: YajQ family cyclic di-GMP-binding protein [Pseudomonadota bacterium]
MPSFDVVSEVDMHEVTNAVDQARREIDTRFDFKGTNSAIEHETATITLVSESDFQLQQILDVLRSKMVKRKIDVGCLAVSEPEMSGQQVRQELTVRQGLDSDLCRNVVKHIKGAKLKVQASIQGDRVRVSGKKRDDLQSVISLLKEEDFGLPFQYENFRD